jgi:hypothetical protein
MGTQRDVHDYLHTVAGQARSIETVATALGLEHDKASQALADLARNGNLGIRRVGRGIYRLDLDRVEIQDDPVNRDVPPEYGVGESLPSVHDWSKMRFVNGAEPPKFLRVLGTDRKGLILIQMPDGTVGRVEPL